MQSYPQELVPNEQNRIAHLIRRKVHALTRYRAFAEDEPGDIINSLWHHWLEQRDQFDPQQGDLETYADVVFNNWIRNTVESRRAAMRDYRRCRLSLDDPVDVANEEGTTRHDIYDQDRYFCALGAREQDNPGSNDLRPDLDRVVRSLPPPLRELCDRLRSRQPVTEIAQEMGVTRETINTWRKRVLAKFAQAGLADYL